MASPRAKAREPFRFTFFLLVALTSTVAVSGQNPTQIPTPVPAATPDQMKMPPANTTTPGAATSGENSGKPGLPGGDTKPASASYASGKRSGLGPLDPAAPPPAFFTRPRIGLALGGGAALALSEVGVLEWFEEHHIPVDVIAGTSMGCMVSALYSSGRTPAQLETVMNDKVFSSVFSFSNSYVSRSFRRREDTRELPNGLTIGLRHRISFRNALLTDQGLNAFLDREFLRYDDQTDFNLLPIPLRCVATDLTDAKPVTFARGSLPDAVRASVSIPAVFKPFEMNGHEYVDGGILENLPTSTVKAMQPDVILAVSLPLSPVGKGDLDSILGVVGRTASVAIEANERLSRKEADVVITPDISGFTANDFLETVNLSKRGYAAAEANHDALLKYAVSDEDWQAYLAHRESLKRGPAAPVLNIRVNAPNLSAKHQIQRLFAPLVNQPVDTAKIEALLDQVRSDGRYDADYTVGYESPQQVAKEAVPSIPAASHIPAPRPDAHSIPIEKPGEPNAKGAARTLPATPETLADLGNRPIILVSVTEKKTGPPFVLFGANLEAQAGGITRATVEGILTDQDLGSYGSELRTHVILGYYTQLDTEYFRPLNFLAAADRNAERTVFLAPHAAFHREPFPIFASSGASNDRVANRELMSETAGLDLGLTNQRSRELRAGLDFIHLGWSLSDGSDSQPDLAGNAQRARLAFTLDTQDRALVPQFGIRLHSEIAFLSDTRSFASPASTSPNAPVFTTQFAANHRFSARAPFSHVDPTTDRGHEILAFAAEAGTMFNRNVAEPFRFTLGGPLRLSASTINQYRGTDYFLIEPALLRRIASLPAPLGQSFYLGAGYEFGQIRSPNSPNITRQDAYFGVVAETPLGVVTLAPAIGTNGERKFIFTIGKLF